MNLNDKKKVWSLRYTPGNSETDSEINGIADTLGVSEVTARLIYNKGHHTAAEAKIFLGASVGMLHDPYDLKDMDKAVQRIAHALDNNEKITVYGDYDVDGVTSVSLIYLYLKALGADIDYYIPSRSKEGYGLSNMAIDNLKASGTQLIITVDTGITANNETEYAKSLGMDMVITDHHECSGELPQACAVVNPHRPDCPYPFKELAGVGVIFKLACAYEIYRRRYIDRLECIENVCRSYIDLVAIGTVADVMPLVDENRIIVKRGLAVIDDSPRCGLEALIEASLAGNTRPAVGEKYPQKKRKINSGFISFTIAPRINAAGRISSAEKAVALLLEEDFERAAVMAEELCEINLQRQREENSIAEKAYKTIEEKHDFENDRVIILDDDSWQQGIIGIVSSRITEKYGLPSILISFDGATRGYSSFDDVGKGSGRSVKGMNLVDALSHCKDLLVRYGGHELAAGLSVMRCNIDEFKKRINDYAREHLNPDDFCVGYEADCEISADELSLSLAEEISMLEPFGVANQTPSFIVRDMRLDKIISMGAGKHSKLLLSSGEESYQAVCFGMSAANLDYYVGERLDLLCQLSANEFKGQISLQLVVQDIKLSTALEQLYEKELSRYKEIISGAAISSVEDVIPTRADIADVYKFFRYENMCGHTVFTYRMLHALIGEQLGRDISGVKLRFITSILKEINVCDVENSGEEYFCVEVCQNAAKTNIELSQTYKKLIAQCVTA